MLADAALVAWDHKYFYNTARPSTVHRSMKPTVSWASLIPTPPHPDYVSGHSTFSGSGARILAHLFGTDYIPVQVEADDWPGWVKSFSKLSDIAADAGKSRIYGGIHTEFANQGGLTAGKALADEIFSRFCPNRSCLN